MKLAQTLTYYENIPTEIYEHASGGSIAVAQEIAELIRERNKNDEPTVLGLATGSSPTQIYAELVRLHEEEGLSFKNVITFNLDEYYPMEPDALQSYIHYMNEHLFNHVDIPKDQIHIPDGTIDRDEILQYCEEYEQEIKDAGGIDIQLLGIGRTGHIGFNEPGSHPSSRTRLITLDKVTRTDAASSFFGEEYVPRHAITMGIGTIMDAHKIIMLAWGNGKAPIIKKAVEDEVDEHIPATFLQEHENVSVVLDNEAAEELTRFKHPWLLSAIDWDDKLMRQAVVWLCQKVNKPILKLTDEDYNEHGMGGLLTQYGAAYDINIKIFNELQHTITGWPGGKPNADDTNRPERAEPFPKRVLIFSPHPDDDVISMGGTLLRLVDQGHEVHIAYQTSGNIAVFDDAVIRFADFVSDYHEMFDLDQEEPDQMLAEIKDFIQNKEPAQPDSEEIKHIKGLIRKSEAKAAGRYCGIPESQLHFMKLPFYETGKVKKKPLSQEDIDITVELLRDVQPHQVYAAGDLSDPHGTHRVCLEAVFRALEACQNDDWIEDCRVWMYRGAWQEWDANEIEMAVPISPDELNAKKMAIFKHQSQKDRPVFPGSDEREFWQRAEDRNRGTAQLYDELGFAEYEAIEGFVEYKDL